MKTDFERSTKSREPPADRVLTVRKTETLSGMYSKMEFDTSVEWRSADTAALAALVKQFGDEP